jgi:integrase
MDAREVLSDPAAQALLLAAINKRLSNIENAVRKVEVVFPVEDAVAAYKKHLRTGNSRRGTPHRKPWNYDYMLDTFLEEFQGQNMAGISPEALDQFVGKMWHNAKSGTVKQRKTQLKSFFSWVIMHLKKKGVPTFSNPCELLDAVHHEVERPSFASVTFMKHALARLHARGSAVERIVFEVLLTSGLRISELLKLVKCDITGRTLRLRDPKSGQKVEHAVVPSTVAKLLATYTANMDDTDTVVPVSEKTAFNIVKNSTRQSMGPHDLRKWCMSYWSRKGEDGMMNFVSRHKHVTLTGRYVAPLSTKEAMGKQDILEEELYGS